MSAAASDNCWCEDRSDAMQCQAVRCSITHRVGTRLKNRLDRMPTHQLFRRSVLSAEAYRIISHYIEDQITIEGFSQRASGAFQRLPAEIMELILLQSSTRDKIAFSATCRAHRAVVERAIFATIIICLRPYSLSLIHLRFIQSCTAAIVAGSVIKHLLFLHDVVKRPAWIQERPTAQGSLDFYCRAQHSRHVSAFLAHATGYTVGNFTGILSNVAGVRRATTLTKDNSPDINVFTTMSDNPLDALLHSPTTADMGALLLDRIWHAYPHLTFSGSAITTPARLPVNNLVSRQRAWDTMQANYDLGIYIDSDFSEFHTCARSQSCPLTPRTNQDSGCLNISLKSLPLSALDTENIWKDRTTVGWMMGTTAFCRSWWNVSDVRSYVDVESYLDHTDVHRFSAIEVAEEGKISSKLESSQVALQLYNDHNIQSNHQKED
ncbi:hypothetical protein C8R43DRAFT_949289 [Mycena crocata]|nr:hypothetical protein C8R43DRAFT_949289 [Mycena crocata]